mmetsp:Transcript_17255/g.51827  ORF Transcript_17255/g.51827 Transcript_17255/m.51827 type:complete len:233 (+) Transcript_17255:134-832(+)|eukprot:349878-Chlamydomonas_euryale.AAC.8
MFPACCGRPTASACSCPGSMDIHGRQDVQRNIWNWGTSTDGRTRTGGRTFRRIFWNGMPQSQPASTCCRASLMPGQRAQCPKRQACSRPGGQWRGAAAAARRRRPAPRAHRPLLQSRPTATARVARPLQFRRRRAARRCLARTPAVAACSCMPTLHRPAVSPPAPATRPPRSRPFRCRAPRCRHCLRCAAQGTGQAQARAAPRSRCAGTPTARLRAQTARALGAWRTPHQAV